MNNYTENYIYDKAIQLADKIIKEDTDRQSEGFNYFNNGRKEGLVQGFKLGIKESNLFDSPFSSIVKSKWKIGDKVNAYGSDGIIALNVYECIVEAISFVFDRVDFDPTIRYKVKCIHNDHSFIVKGESGLTKL